MAGMAGNMLEELMPCACCGLGGACFYQRDFSLERHALAVLLLAAAGWCNTAGAALLVARIVLHGKVGILTEAVRRNGLMAITIAAFMVVHRTCLPGRRTYAVMTAVSAAFQLTRRPEWLKAYTRPVRVATGPLYVFAAVLALAQHSDGCQRYVARAGMSLVAVASTVLRPDNHEMLRLLGCVGIPMPSMQRSRWLHGMFMLVSMCCLVLVLLMDGAVAPSDAEKGEGISIWFMVMLAAIEVSRRMSGAMVLSTPEALAEAAPGIVGARAGPTEGRAAFSGACWG
eukprot:CAMPEP_0171169156 /NCGR_PEP_ID=MMETSP0790-20130122/8071_1 /TAXON_ID=2925 /ORGANISM="Alexandrium catenella, Strain OF101" /LENGTH=284 /DNA_ID=CAMNT_0011633999 /DNA_START=27 /DNA_END=882 /DNA_ORIENTATION=-